MTRKEFFQLPYLQQQMFFSKLLHAIRHDEHYFQFAASVIENATLDGMFNDVKFGIEISETEKDLLAQQLNEHQ